MRLWGVPEIERVSRICLVGICSCNTRACGWNDARPQAREHKLARDGHAQVNGVIKSFDARDAAHRNELNSLRLWQTNSKLPRELSRRMLQHVTSTHEKLGGHHVSDQLRGLSCELQVT